MIQNQDKISALFHPPSCSCCGGGLIQFGAEGKQNSSDPQAFLLDPALGFSGANTNVTLITEADIQNRKAEMGLSGNDWSYVSSLFFNDADFYDGVFFKWGGALGTAPSLTYSFVNQGTFYADDKYRNDFSEVDSLAEIEGFVNFNNSDSSHYMIEFSQSEKQFIRDTLEDYSNSSGIQFTEVYDNNYDQYGDLRFFLQDFSVWQNADPDLYSYGGFAYGPWGDSNNNSWIAGGDIFLRSDYELFDGFAEHTIVHEIGHALGLSHPFDGYNIIGNLDNSLDNQYSVMTYDEDPPLLGISPMPIDMLAMEFLYGGYESANLDDTAYWLDPKLFAARTDGYGYSDARMSIIDDGGVDRIDASSLNSNIFLNLAPGSWSNLKSTDPILWAPVYDKENEYVNMVSEQIASSSYVYSSGYEPRDDEIRDNAQLFIDSTSFIENCDLTPYSDIVFDNSASNIIQCNAGDDLVSISFGDDTVYGGAGIDEVTIYGVSSDYAKAAKLGNGYTLRNVNESSSNFNQLIHLDGVETVSFYDDYGFISSRSDLDIFSGAQLNGSPTISLLSEPEVGIEKFYFFEGEQISFDLLASDGR